MENTALLQIQNSTLLSGSNGVWINFNDIQVEGCWVVGDAACAYYKRAITFGQVVAISIVGGLIVCSIGVLQIYCCSQYRRKQFLRAKRKKEITEQAKQLDFVSVPV